MFITSKKIITLTAGSNGRDRGSVGRAVAFDTRGLRFESIHRHNIYIEHVLSTALKRRKQRKRGQEWPIFKKKNV